jgi:nucleoside-diphosphate-sugar epimerase
MSERLQKTCLITGATGYLGSELKLHLKKSGWRVIGTSRLPRDKDTIQFSFDGGLDPEILRGIDAVVHCAYDFAPSSWDEIYRANVLGTRNLLQAAKSVGVKTIVAISSISAFPGCRSLYGRAKLEIENQTLAVGGIALRPGLIYGGSNRGMYGRLAKQVKAGRPVPLLIGSPCIQYLIHADDLSNVIEAILSVRVPSPDKIWTVAHPRPWPLRKLLEKIAESEGMKIRFVPVPWQFIWLTLKCLESVGLKLGFKSDGVKSLAHQNPKPELGQPERAGLGIRDFNSSS